MSFLGQLIILISIMGPIAVLVAMYKRAVKEETTFLKMFRSLRVIFLILSLLPFLVFVSDGPLQESSIWRSIAWVICLSCWMTFQTMMTLLGWDENEYSRT